MFAPINEAFEKLPKGAVADLLRPENEQQLIELIRRHVVAGEYNTAQVENEMTLKTIGNDALTLSSNESGTVKIGGDSIISQPDIYSSNGIVHIITEVLSQ